MSVVALAPIQAQSVKIPPSIEAIAKAKADFMDFVKSEHFEPVAGSVIDLGIALKIVYTDAKGDPKHAFANTTGFLFAELFHAAEVRGHLTSAAKVFFDECLDQVPFVDDLAKQVIAYADEVEAADGVHIESSEQAIAAAQTELLEFIQSDDFESLAGCSLDAFKQKLAEIARRSQGDWMTAYLVDLPDSPGYSRLFSELIENAAKDGFISEKVSQIYTAPGFDPIPFVKHIIDKI